MKQTLFKWRLIVGTIILLIVVFSVAIINEGYEKSFLKFDSIETQSVTLFQVRNLLNHSAPDKDYTGEFAFKASLGSTPNNGLINQRQIPPIWERTFFVKQVIVLIGFFFAIMLISLFFIFYQNARTGSEGDDIFMETLIGC